MDLVPQFNDLLRKRDSPPLKQHDFSLQDVDEFLKEAYLINKHISELNVFLRSVRQSSIASRKNEESKYLTDQERTQIDAQAKQVLRELNASINQLSETEQIRRDAESTIALKKRAKRGLGGLGRWAAGGAITAKSAEELEDEAKANAVKMHRESVIWYLQRHLEETGRYQSEMMEIRLTREVEKSKSILYKASGTVRLPDDNIYIKSMANGQAPGPSSSYRSAPGQHIEDFDRKEVEQQLSPEQLQLFAQENVDMLKHYEDTLDQVRTAEKSLLEISELQTTLAGNLAIQSAHIEQLVQDSHLTEENVGSGNKELKRATERRSTAQGVFWSTVAFCGVVLIMDLVF